jgi:hypothetical protein
MQIFVWGFLRQVGDIGAELTVAVETAEHALRS